MSIHVYPCREYYALQWAELYRNSVQGPNKFFKCPGFYCILWRYVCNNKWECPGGTDENSCPKSACPGLFKCKNSTICISKESLCDFVSDCDLNDDENFCSDQKHFCPPNCSCLLFSLSCKSKTLDICCRQCKYSLLGKLALLDNRKTHRPPVGNHRYCYTGSLVQYRCLYYGT